MITGLQRDKQKGWRHFVMIDYSIPDNMIVKNSQNLLFTSLKNE